jgi:hypothetical protein
MGQTCDASVPSRGRCRGPRWRHSAWRPGRFGWLPLVPIRMRRLTAERTARRRTADSAALPAPAASRIPCKHVRSRVRHGRSAVARTLHLTAAVTRDSGWFLARCLEVDGLAAPVPASRPPSRPSPSWPPTSSPPYNLPLPRTRSSCRWMSSSHPRTPATRATRAPGRAAAAGTTSLARCTRSEAVSSSTRPAGRAAAKLHLGGGPVGKQPRRRLRIATVPGTQQASNLRPVDYEFCAARPAGAGQWSLRRSGRRSGSRRSLDMSGW